MSVEVAGRKKRNAIRYMLLGILAGLVAPVGLFAYGFLEGRPLEPLKLFSALAAGGMLVLGACGWMIGNRDDALRARNRELRSLTRRLSDLSATDALTGIANRRAFDERLKVELARAARYGTPLSLVMIDLDRFKDLNDKFGHPTGDAVLRSVASILDHEKRLGDLVARYGGEEFAAILPHTDRDSAAAWAERVRRTIAGNPIDSSGDRLEVTASFGIAATSASEQTDELLLAAADKALYEAKHQGRNSVALARFTGSLLACAPA